MAGAIAQIRMTETEAGVRQMGDSRVSLDSAIYAFKTGSFAEEIASDFDSLSLGDVYAVIAYYPQNAEEVERCVSERERENAKIRESVQHRSPAAGLRTRLLARDLAE